MCPIRHCLDRSLPLNSCQQSICICKADIDRSVFWGNLCMFVPVAHTVKFGISESWEECHSADKPQNNVQHSDNAPYTHSLSHLPCSTAVFGHQTNCSCTRLHVTAVSCTDSRTDSIHRFCPICGIQQKATEVPKVITNRTSGGSSTIQL